MTIVVLTSCSSDGGDRDDEPAATATSFERAVSLTTTGCGWASGRTGSGVAIDDDTVVTVAHLVVRSASVSASFGDGVPVDAVVVAVDAERDLALLRIPPIDIGEADVAPISPDTHSGVMVEGAASGTVPFTIKRPARISIEEVLGTQRHDRLGYELDAVTRTGDSGAGIYDNSDRLLGIVFATSDAGSVTWATASSEVLAFLDAHETATTPLECDATRSRLDTAG